MASAAEIVVYYQRLMEHGLLPTGRVTFVPMCTYQNDGTVISQVSGRRFRIVARRKVVDATYLPSPVPATHKRSYEVAEGVMCVPINTLASLVETPKNFCVVGSGKTGMDACLWLLAQGVAPDRIRWIMPREAWWIDRARVQFDASNVEAMLAFATAQMEALSEARSIDALFLGFESRGIAVRLDPDIMPTMWHNATITRSELAELRRIKDVVRAGRVRRIERGQIVLEQATQPVHAQTLYIDCSAVGLTSKPAVPVFSDGRITLQLVRLLRPCLSGSIIGFLELHFGSNAEKNAMATPVPLPEVPADWPRMTAISMANQSRMSERPEIVNWLASHRLDPGAGMMAAAVADPVHRSQLERMRAAVAAGSANLPNLRSTHASPSV